MKDHDRRLLDYVETELTRHLRREVGSINHYLADIKVELPGVEHVGPYWLVAGSYLLPTAPHVRRIFNRASFDKGGRLYGWWQALPSGVRLNLSLDCQPALDPSAECDCIGGFNFARAPGTGLWIEFGDLPEATREALRVRDDDEVPF